MSFWNKYFLIIPDNEMVHFLVRQQISSTLQSLCSSSLQLRKTGSVTLMTLMFRLNFVKILTRPHKFQFSFFMFYFIQLHIIFTVSFFIVCSYQILWKWHNCNLKMQNHHNLTQFSENCKVCKKPKISYHGHVRNTKVNDTSHSNIILIVRHSEKKIIKLIK